MEKFAYTEIFNAKSRRFRNLKILNFAAISAFLFYIGLYSIIDFKGFLLLIVLHLAGIVPFLMSIYFNSKQKFKIASYLLAITLTMVVALTKLFVDKLSGLHFFFLLFALMPIITIPVKDWGHLLFLIFLNLFFFGFYEFIFEPQKHIVVISYEYYKLFQMSVYFCSFIVIAAVLYSIKFTTEKFEHLLKSQSDNLLQMNQQMNYQQINLQDVNAQLEERQNQIEEQSEILYHQKKELELANRKLQEFVITKDKFFSIIAHDLKTLINSILGFSELLKLRKNTLSDIKRDKYILNISQSARNTYNLLENLLEWAQSQSDKVTLTPVTIELNKLIEENVNLFIEQAKSKKITIHNIYNSDDPIVVCDKNMIKTVLRNLISNAIKFTPSGGKITIASKAAKNKNAPMIKVEVTDTGIGVNSGDLENLFLIDKSYSTTGTDGEKGSGLGLILCKEFVERNGGEIWIKSAINKGSSFCFTLPLRAV